jgi:hypothetical protein
MNDYMRENKLEPVLPQLSTDTVAHAGDGDAKKRSASADKPTDKTADKARARDGAASAPTEKARKQES